MRVSIEIPDDQVARFQKEAESRGLSLDNWLLALAQQNAPTITSEARRRTVADVFAKVRGLADDLDFSRDPSPGRDIAL